MYLFKVNSDDIAVPRLINVLVLFLRLSKLFLGDRLDYSSLCSFLFNVLDIY